MTNPTFTNLSAVQSNIVSGVGDTHIERKTIMAINYAKLFNRRVKGSEKFWSEQGAEAILQLRADYLSENEPLDRFWEDRQACSTGRRCYRRSG